MQDLKKLERETYRLCGLYLKAAPGLLKQEAHRIWANKAREYEAVFWKVQERKECDEPLIKGKANA